MEESLLGGSPPVSKWLVNPIYKPFGRGTWKGTTLLRGPSSYGSYTPRKQTCNLKMMVPKFGISSSKGAPIFRFHVRFRGYSVTTYKSWDDPPTFGGGRQPSSPPSDPSAFNLAFTSSGIPTKPPWVTWVEHQLEAMYAVCKN